jgi:hypothetical protein
MAVMHSKIKLHVHICFVLSAGEVTSRCVLPLAQEWMDQIGM